MTYATKLLQQWTLLLYILLKGVEDFLENYQVDEKIKYMDLARELVNNRNNILNVCISDIKSHNLALMKLINIFIYQAVFRVLCSSLKKLVKNKIDQRTPCKTRLNLAPCLICCATHTSVEITLTQIILQSIIVSDITLYKLTLTQVTNYMVKWDLNWIDFPQQPFSILQ